MSQTNALQPKTASLEGRDLLHQLQQDWSKLPTRSVVAMALGGLRVRLLRSLVTMLSIILAIAFLSYTGLSNLLTQNLAEELRRLDQATSIEAASQLSQLLRRAAVDIEKTLAGNPLDTWLIVMALLTCTVGIANAMLMSVTERIREIGTMKCLGAQDSLIIKLFLLESALMGAVGATVGILLGVLIALLAGVLQFRSFGLSHFPMFQGWTVIFWSFTSGILLAVTGAVYPAFAASRMRPVDALSVDE